MFIHNEKAFVEAQTSSKACECLHIVIISHQRPKAVVGRL